jgi:cytoskeleton protein RodZ
MARKVKETKLGADQVIEITEENSVQADDGYGIHYRSRCGGALRVAREGQGLSIQDIANRLRLGPKQIEALEADNFAALPEPTIVRGFIRNYAKQLKINVEPLLDAYSVMVPSTELHGLIVTPSAKMKMTSQKKPKPGRYALIGLVALIGLGALLFYQNYVEKPSPVALSEGAIGETVAVENTVSVESLPEIALPAAERETKLQPSTELTLPAPTADATTNPAIASASNVAAATTTLPAPLAPAAPATLPPQAFVAPNGMAKLEFNANQETWISVVDASGKEIYNKIIFAGSRESIDVTPPVNVTVGNAGATSMSMNGKPVELAPHMRGNVARLKLE